MIEIEDITRSPKRQRGEVIVAGVMAAFFAAFGLLLGYFYVTDPASGWFTLVMAGVFGLFALMAGISAVTEYRAIHKANQLAEGGRQTEGVVIQLTRSHPSPGDWRYFVRYTFTDEAGQQYQCQTRIQPGDYTALHEGGPITVRYLPSEPTTHRPVLP